MPPIIPRSPGVRPAAPVPGVRINPNAPLEAFGGGAAAPQANLDRLAQVADAIWQRERDRVDAAAVLEGDNEAWEIERTLFYDPENGAFTKRGKDALPAMETAMEQYQQKLSEIESTLTTERQKGAFRERAQRRRIALDEQGNRYAAEQIRQYADVQFQGALDVLTNRAALAFDNPEQLELYAAEKRALITNYGQLYGIDKEALQAQITAELSKSHSVVMSRFLAQGRDLAAKDYFTKFNAELTPNDRVEVERQLKTATIDGQGMREAGAVWATMGPKQLNDPVRMADMENAVREQLQDSPDSIRAAIQDLRTRAEAFNAQQREVTASNAATAIGAFNNGRTRAEVLRMPEYLALNGTDQEKINSYMMDRNKTLSDRAREDRTRRGFAAYWQYSQPVVLDAMSENEILALEPELGQELTAALMNGKRSMAKGDVRAASIDADQFNHLLRLADYDPTDKKKAAEIGSIKYHVENAIEAKQQSVNRQLTRQEKAEVMSQIINDRVMIDNFFFDKIKPLATVQRDELGRAYVPIEQLQKDKQDLFITEGLNYMRSLGLILPQTTDAQALTSHLARRIERAYVMRRAGGTTEDIAAILRGEQ